MAGSATGTSGEFVSWQSQSAKTLPPSAASGQTPKSRSNASDWRQSGKIRLEVELGDATSEMIPGRRVIFAKKSENGTEIRSEFGPLGSEFEPSCRFRIVRSAVFLGFSPRIAVLPAASTRLAALAHGEPFDCGVNTERGDLTLDARRMP